MFAAAYALERVAGRRGAPMTAAGRHGLRDGRRARGARPASRPRRRSSAAARRISARRRTAIRARCASACPGALPVLNDARRRAGDPRRARARLHGAPDVDLRAQELLLSRSAQGLSDLAVRPAARDARARDARVARRRAAIDRHHAPPHGGGRRQVDPRSVPRRDRGRPQSRRRAARRDRERAGHPRRRRGRRVSHDAQADPRVRRRQRREHGGGKSARRRQRQRAARRRRRRSAPRPRSRT